MCHLKEVIIMAVQKRTSPVVLGTLVTGIGATMVALEVAPMIAAGVVGFGIAHIVLGASGFIATDNR
jgi:hypothetical protein